MEIGLQTFTIKKAIATPGGLDKAMAEVSAAGIKYLEVAVDYLEFPFDENNARMMRETFDKYGIKAVSCQIRQKKVESNPDGYSKAFGALGVKYITNSVIDVRCLKDGAKGVASYSQNLEKYRLRLEDMGLVLAHHNHHFECLSFGGETVLDIMAQNYNGGFVPDTYWLTRGGIEPVSLIKKLGGRVRIMHIRDYRLKLSLLGLKPADAAIGCGNIDFEYVLGSASKLGVEYGMIEQSTKEELASAKKSAANALAITGRIKNET